MKLLKTESRQVWLVCILCLITFFVNNRVLVPDIMESRNIIAAREMVYDGHWVVPTMNGDLRLEKPPLPTWLTAVAEMAAPDNLALQRGMAGLAAVLLVFYFWQFARRILRVDPLIPTLLLCTCYNIILMGRTASWDIYCHAFMMGGIYHLARALAMPSCGWRHFLMAGVLTGLSILSKGPVSPYALLLPFLVSFGYYYRPSLQGKRGALVVMVVLALVVGCWWYAYVYLSHGDAFAAVAQKESGSWFNHNVRPWWYYWKFFLETGVWSLLLLTAIFLPLFDKEKRTSKTWLFSLVWMLLSLVLLSLLPEKKTRYLLPLLIPACYVMGCLVEMWKKAFLRPLPQRIDKVAFRVNVGLVACVVVVLPVVAWSSLIRPGSLSWGTWVFFTLVCLCIACYLVHSLRKLKPVGLLVGVAVLFLYAECFAWPYIGGIVNNPEMKSIALTREIKELDGLPFYYNEQEPLRIELVYAAHRKIRPLAVDSAEDVLRRLPCAVLTHKRVGEELPEALWAKVDTVYVGRFDDNRRPVTNHRYNDMFVYHVTILKSKE